MLKDYFLLTLLNYRQDYKLGTGIPVRAQRDKRKQPINNLIAGKASRPTSYHERTKT